MPNTSKKTPESTNKMSKAVLKAQITAKWAKTMTKWLISRHNGDGTKWHIINFIGPKGSESRGIVDLLAVRKDHGNNPSPLKKGDLFEIVLIQVKGGSAKDPTAADVERLKLVQDRYHACGVLLSTWQLGKKLEFRRLQGNEWVLLKDPSEVFNPGKQKKMRS
jgi:hypothetical protein